MRQVRKMTFHSKTFLRKQMVTRCRNKFRHFFLDLFAGKHFMMEGLKMKCLDDVCWQVFNFPI